MEPRAPSEQDVLVGRGEGETITDRENREVTLIAVRDEITMTRSRYGPGERGPDPHVHHEHADSFYVLDGELTFALGPDGERVIVPAGGFVAVPPNVSHSFRNEGSAERPLPQHAHTGRRLCRVHAWRPRRRRTSGSTASTRPPTGAGRRPKRSSSAPMRGSGSRRATGSL